MNCVFVILFCIKLYTECYFKDRHDPIVSRNVLILFFLKHLKVEIFILYKYDVRVYVQAEKSVKQRFIAELFKHMKNFFLLNLYI